MKRIFISTNGSQPANCFKIEDDQKAIKKLLLEININSSDKEILFSNNVYLIHDKLNVLTNIQVNKNEDCLLYHKLTKAGIKDLFSKKLEGHHTQNENDYYKLVFSIFLDNGNMNKLDSILYVLSFTDEALQEKDNFKSKLNLLHKCLSPETLKTITDSAFEKLFNEKNSSIEASGNIVDPISDPDLEKLTGEEKPGFYTFKSNVGQITDPFDGKYVQQLTSLRTSFLSQK